MIPLGPNQSERVRRARQVVLILALAMAASLVAMPVIVVAALGWPSPPQEAEGPLRTLLPLVFLVESLVVAAAVLWLSPRFPDLAFRRRKPTVATAIGAWVTGHIIAFALAEGIGINGVVLLALDFPLPVGVGFMGGALVLLLLVWPRSGSLSRFLARLERRYPGSLTGSEPRAPDTERGPEAP